MHDPERIHTGDKANMLKAPEAVVEFLRGIRVPFEHCHAGLQLGNIRQLALFRAVFPVDRVTPVIDAAALISESLHKQAGAANAPSIVCSRADIGPAEALLYGGDQFIDIKHYAHLPSEKWGVEVTGLHPRQAVLLFLPSYCPHAAGQGSRGVCQGFPGYCIPMKTD